MERVDKMLTIAKSRLESLKLPRLDGHHQDQAHCGGEQRGQQEVGDRPERDHSRHLNKVSWKTIIGIPKSHEREFGTGILFYCEEGPGMT